MSRPSSTAPRALVFLALAVTLGSTVIGGLVHLITEYQERIHDATRPEDTVMVIVAARDLYQGVEIRSEDLYAVQIPPRFLPEGVYLSPEHVVGRIPRERILANEMVRGDRLSLPEAQIGLNALLPRGTRAISVAIADGAALAGFLRPTDYVDVLATLEDPEDGATVTKTLLQAMFVLGVDSRLSGETREEAYDERGRQRPSITLLATPEQAEQIAHAERLGELRVVLRNGTDLGIADVSGADLDSLRRRLAKAAAPLRPTVAAPAKKCTELHKILGDDVVIQLVDEHGIPCR